MALSKRRVIAWLDTLPTDARVGYRNLPCKCPFAEFLRWDGATSPHVGTATYTRKSGMRRRDNPQWMSDVLARIDIGPPGPVTAAEMRTYIEGVG